MPLVVLFIKKGSGCCHHDLISSIRNTGNNMIVKKLFQAGSYLKPKTKFQDRKCEY